MLRLKASFKRFVGSRRDGDVALAKRTEANVHPPLRRGGNDGGSDRPRFRSPRPDERNRRPAKLSPLRRKPRDLTFEEMEGMSGRLAFAAPRRDRRDVPGGVRLARSAPRRRARRHLPVGRHGVSRAAFHLWRLDGRGLRRKRSRGQAQLPGGTRRNRVFRLVRMSVEGGGPGRSIKATARTPPAPQASCSELAARSSQASSRAARLWWSAARGGWAR